MVAYVQVDNKGNWINENCYASAKGFERMGYIVVPFSLDTLDNFDFKDADVVHGGIKAVRKIIDMIGVTQPLIHNPHDHLPQYLGRKMWESTLRKVALDYGNGTPPNESIFIKPLSSHKLFTGKVIRSFVDMIPLGNIDMDTPILASEVSNYISEYRCFVNRKELVGAKNYTGDFRVIPDFNMVEQAIKDYREQPISYSIDFGITDNGETQLIEINDGFALGSYGLNPIIYCKMIKDRWNEIKNKL
jgi:hypothetical protein